ncbi:MAG: TetR family transcriptional regulator [Actinomycetota bacterium]
MSEGRRRPGPKPSISRTSIARAAVDVGFAGLTVKAVADQLGVTHGALYGHVADRDDLVLAAVEEVVASLDTPQPTADWRSFLQREAVAVWRMFAAHPGMYDELFGTGRVPLPLRERLAQLLAIMRGYGFDPTAALTALDVVYDLASDSARRSAQLDARVDADEGYPTAWATELSEVDAVEVARAFATDPAVWFERKLRVVLSGIAGELAPQE